MTTSTLDRETLQDGGILYNRVKYEITPPPSPPIKACPLNEGVTVHRAERRLLETHLMEQSWLKPTTKVLWETQDLALTSPSGGIFF